MPAESTELPPFPPAGGFIQAIRDSSRKLREYSNVKIEPASIERLLTSPAFTTSFERLSKAHGLAFPLKFPSVVAELNLLAVLALLNFASGYRVPLHAQTGRGAWDNIRALVFGMYLTSSTESDLLSAAGMRAASPHAIAELMQVSVHVERPHGTLQGVTVGELGGPMHELVQLISDTLRETGEVLQGLGYPDLGSFVLEALKAGEKAGKARGTGTDVDVILEQIVRAIPGFRDMAVVNGFPIYAFKKALFLIHSVSIRFCAGSPPVVPVPDTSTLPVFSDNVLPSILIHLGVLDVGASPPIAGVFEGAPQNLPALLAAHDPTPVVAKLPVVPKAGPVLTHAQAYILRAAAIDASEMIVDVAKKLGEETLLAAGADPACAVWMNRMTLPDIDMWLWAVAKDRPDYRRLERFSLTNTVMF